MMKIKYIIKISLRRLMIIWKSKGIIQGGGSRWRAEECDSKDIKEREDFFEGGGGVPAL